MSKSRLLATCAVLASAVLVPGRLRAQQPGAVDSLGLKTMVEGMGYETKPIKSDNGKFEFTVKISGLDVPIGAELSGSKNLIWFTVFLGKAPAETASTKFTEMLKRNFTIQPSSFYITDTGNLMMGIPVENRTVSAVVLRRWVEKLANDVGATKELWQ